jgi:cell division septal protein FtsQ
MVTPKRKVKTRAASDKINKNIIGKVIYYFALLSFVFAIIYVLFFSHFLTITSIDVSGTQNVSQQDVLDKINNDLAGKYLNIVDKNNLLLFRSSSVEKQLKQDFKKINDVSVRKKFPSAITIEIRERNPVLIFSAGGKYFITDDNGQAFEEIDSNSVDFQNSSWPVFTDNSNAKIELYEDVLVPDLLNFFLGARKKLESDLDITLDRSSETPNRMSYDIRMKTTDGWVIYLNGNLDLNKEMDILKTVLDSKIPKADRPNLEYIDLRSDNKVFYKFKDGVQQDGNSGEEANQNNTTNAPDKSEIKKDDKKKKKV